MKNGMTHLETYELEVKTAVRFMEAKKRQALKKYIENTAKYSVGDILRNNTRTIRVEKIEPSLSYNKPIVLYYGIELLKTLKENKRQNKGYIEEGNVNNPIILIKKGEK